jgi:hypothetical protein
MKRFKPGLNRTEPLLFIEEDNFLDELDQNVSFEEDLNSYAYGNVEHIRYVNY